MILMGKHKPSYTPFLDTGDHVVVINAAKVMSPAVKKSRRSTGISPGIPADWWRRSIKRVRQEKPARIIEDAISGMLPKTKLGKQMYRKLKVYAGDKHPHAAQKPSRLTIK